MFYYIFLQDLVYIIIVMISSGLFYGADIYSFNADTVFKKVLKTGRFICIVHKLLRMEIQLTIVVDLIFAEHFTYILTVVLILR